MKKIFIAGHNGMVGKSLFRILSERTDIKVVTRTRQQLDLCNYDSVLGFMKSEKPDEVLLAAAKVGGIHSNNTYPAEFIYQNLQIQNNVIHAAHTIDVQKLLFLGSSCIYPRDAAQPIHEESLLEGKLELTNEPYAIAKIAGLKMCESYNRQYGRDYRSIMPTNLYGPGDNYHALNSHVIPALLRRFHEAKVNNLSDVIVWGSGSPRREFLYIDDMAEASLFVHEMDSKLFKNGSNQRVQHINVGSGYDVSISDLASLIVDVVQYKGSYRFDISKPDGTPRKLLDSSKLLGMGWRPSTDLKLGLRRTYEDYVMNNCNQ